MSKAGKVFRLIGALAMVATIAAAGGLTSRVWAEDQDQPRFPHAHITAKEWQKYLDEVQHKTGAQDVSRADTPDVLAIAVRDENTVYYFTKPGGPAHPAVVLLKIVKNDKDVSIFRRGYFAGSEEAFGKWYASFAVMEQKIRDKMNAGN